MMIVVIVVDIVIIIVAVAVVVLEIGNGLFMFFVSKISKINKKFAVGE